MIDMRTVSVNDFFTVRNVEQRRVYDLAIQDVLDADRLAVGDGHLLELLSGEATHVLFHSTLT